MTQLVLRANAVADATLGLVLLLATWDELYDQLHLPAPSEAIYAQIAGVFALTFGFLLWIAHRDIELTRAVAMAAGMAHALATLVAIAWLIESRLDLPANDALLLGLLASASATFAAAEFTIARTRQDASVGV